jgi:hypothetical protein
MEEFFLVDMPFTVGIGLVLGSVLMGLGTPVSGSNFEQGSSLKG